MKELVVYKEGKPSYPISLCRSFDQLKNVCEQLSLQDKKICIISESRVASFYLEELVHQLTPHCAKVITFVFPEGEKSKNLDTVNDAYKFLIEQQVDRDDCLLALGGGVVGDLTGYVAATYLRGIRFIQCPTSLLAMVDSSIGGKTGVDFSGYKNMVGAFYQPVYVYMNLSTLATLNERQFHSGFGEIIKHSLIEDIEYFHLLEQTEAANIVHNLDMMEEIIYRSLQIKKSVVEEDPFEKGKRVFLNFGHTLGHAIEKQMNFTLLHGECVSLGIVAVARIALNRQMISEDEFNLIKQLLVKYQLPVNCPNVDVEKCISATKNDKKAHQGNVTFILPDHIGQVVAKRDILRDEMIDALTEVKQG